VTLFAWAVLLAGLGGVVLSAGVLAPARPFRAAAVASLVLFTATVVLVLVGAL
jgi:hypothetical protein